MRERWVLVPTQTAHQLQYIDGPNSWPSLLLLCPGLLGLVGTTTKMVEVWPADRLSYCLGIMFCVLLIAGGGRFLAQRVIRFTKSPARLVLGTRWLFAGRTKTLDLTCGGAVTRRTIVDDRNLVWASGEAIEAVVLLSPAVEGGELILCKADPCAGVSAQSMVDEISRFLGWSAIDSASDDAPVTDANAHGGAGAA